jgi:hypothetical protein
VLAIKGWSSKPALELTSSRSNTASRDVTIVSAHLLPV